MIMLGTTKTKWFIASGALGFDGRGYWFESLHRLLGLIDPTPFVVIAKTVTRPPMRGNLRWWKRFGGCVRLLDVGGNPLNEWHYLRSSARIAGTVNAVGLTNPGLDAWCRWYRVRWQTDSRFQLIPLVPSILASSPWEAAEMAEQLTYLPRLAGVEVNLYCPNCLGGTNLIENADLGIGIVKAVKATVGDLPVLVKLSPQQDYLKIAGALRGQIAAISVNSVPWTMVFPNKPSPLRRTLGVDGGVSGRIAQPILWPMVRKLVELDAAPVIGPSVWNYGDIDTLFTCLGAAAVHFGAIFLRGLQGPCLPNRFVNQYDAPTAT